MRYGVRKKKELVLWGILCVGLILLYLLSSTDWIIKEKEVEVYPVSLIISEKLKSPLRCVVGDGQIDMTTRTALGNAHDCCPIDGSGNGLEIGFNNKYMMDALKAAPQDKVTLELSSPITPCIIVPAEGEENFLFMVLPVRLKAES